MAKKVSSQRDTKKVKTKILLDVKKTVNINAS